MAVRPVSHEWGLFIWALDDGTGVVTGQFRDDAGSLAVRIAQCYPGPLLLRGPGTERLADQMGDRVCVDPNPGDTSEIDRVLSQYEEETVASLPRLVLATDGSADNTGHAGLGWAGDDGRHFAHGWRRTGGSRQSNALRAEFAAVVSAIDNVNPRRRLELQIDNRTVLADVEKAVQGLPVQFGSRFPPRTLARLVEMDIRPTWVKGHHGHWLNETADRLAVYARRCSIAGMSPREEVTREIVDNGGLGEAVGAAG